MKQKNLKKIISVVGIALIVFTSNTKAQALNVVPNIKEGIPESHVIPDPKPLISEAYTTATLLQRAIEEAQSLPTDGAKIQHFEMMAKRIVVRSGSNPWEQAIRMAMNRSMDVMNAVLPHAGNNSEFVASWGAQFYEENFELAIALLNNPATLDSRDGANRASRDQKGGHLSIAEFGRIYSQLLLRASASLTSGSLKAVLRMKMISFLGWDINQDLRRQDPNLKEILADISALQTEDQDYAAVLHCLTQRQEPDPQNLTQLISKTARILDRVVPAFRAAGIAMLVGQ